MAIQVRRGNEADFDPSKMLPGEFAVSIDTRIVRICLAPGIVKDIASTEEVKDAILKGLIDIKNAEENALENIADGLDKTLSVEGKAAEAKTTGEKISQLSSEIDNLDIYERKNLIRGTLDGFCTSDFKIESTGNSYMYSRTKPLYFKKGDIVYTPYYGVYGTNRYAYKCNESGTELLKALDANEEISEYNEYIVMEDGFYTFNISFLYAEPCVTTNINHLNEVVGVHLPNVVNINEILENNKCLERYNLITEVMEGFWATNISTLNEGYWHSNPIHLKQGDIVYLSNVKSTYGATAGLYCCDKDGTRWYTCIECVEETTAYLKFEIPYNGYFSANILQDSCLCYDVSNLDKKVGYYLPKDTHNVSDFVKRNKISPLYKKFISLNGDSICQGAGLSGGYGKIIADMYNMTYENLGIGGGTITAESYYDNGNARHWICRTIENMSIDADYILLEGGVNDSMVAIGSISEGYTADLDDTTYCGAMESVCKQLITRFADKKIGFVLVHKMTDKYCSNYAGENNRYLLAKEILEKWGVPYCDLNVSVPPLGYISELKTAYTYNGDGWHPNEEGYKKYYVPKIVSFLESL